MTFIWISKYLIWIKLVFIKNIWDTSFSVYVYFVHRIWFKGRPFKQQFIICHCKILNSFLSIISIYHLLFGHCFSWPDDAFPLYPISKFGTIDLNCPKHNFFMNGKNLKCFGKKYLYLHLLPFCFWSKFTNFSITDVSRSRLQLVYLFLVMLVQKFISAETWYKWSS